MRAADPQALKALWDLYFKPLVFFAQQLVRDSQVSEDIVSETFAKIWLMKDRFDTVPNIKAFLYVTVRNSCYDVLRSRQIHDRIHKDILYTSEQTSELPEDDYNVLYADYLQQLYAQVDALPDRCKEVFKLYFFGQLSTREIAQQLHISEQTARNQKTKAVQLLRNLLLKKDRIPASLAPLLAILLATEV